MYLRGGVGAAVGGARLAKGLPGLSPLPGVPGPNSR